ncbi:probable L-type lectin-domain containing receptor kinase S.7 [Coffea arabica]|uniref:Probable L-type lectin-domain containing receptor kinase S.7 n=1 Tax=Coffea arabica TaxID=13443 RepID=A0ABM4UF71_COFAR
MRGIRARKVTWKCWQEMQPMLRDCLPTSSSLRLLVISTKRICSVLVALDVFTKGFYYQILLRSLLSRKLLQHQDKVKGNTWQRCTIGRLRHKNLVQLQDWCHDKDQLFLVHEYMPNVSLDRYIGKVSLGWKIRYRILSGLASALLYLHEECGNPVVHRDVKPNNVMLDSEFNAHLGDFGLARLLQNDNFVNTMVAGTPGYLAPEVSYTGRATLESDVYSFGMVVLELVCGRRSRGMMEENSLVDHVWTTHEKNELFTCVDPTLEGKFDEEEVRRSILVGLACMHPDRRHRPRMGKWFKSS